MFKQVLVAQTETWTILKSSKLFLILNLSGCFYLSDLDKFDFFKIASFKNLLRLSKQASWIYSRLVGRPPYMFVFAMGILQCSSVAHVHFTHH